jgi:hypothetical protein
MKKALALMTMATHVAFVAPAFANSPTSSLDQHGDVSLDDQVARYKQVTMRQNRNNDFCTHIKAHLAA